MTSQGRRKHSECLFRMRENCQFRKLKRNKCGDSRNSIVSNGEQWGASKSQIMAGPSVSNSNINTAVSIESLSRPPANLQSVSHPQEELSAMDTDMPPSAARPNYMVSGTAGRSSFSLINHQQHNLSSSDTSMELDSGVDPETGERAQG